ncbi:MAG: CRTAC1 family protein [Planctomycetaceae bacterium]
MFHPFAVRRLILLGGLVAPASMLGVGCDPRVKPPVPPVAQAPISAGEIAKSAGLSPGGTGDTIDALRDVAEASGLQFTPTGQPAAGYFMPEIMGAGAGFLDYDSDGLLDVVLIEATWDAQTQQRRSRARLFQQFAPTQFRDRTEVAGLDWFDSYGVGLAIGDIDADGDPDLYLTAFGPDQFFLNNGDGTFQQANDWFDQPNPRWATAASFVDFDGDGLLDLHVLNYLDYYPSAICEDNRQRPDYCGPRSFPGTLGKHYRNSGEKPAEGAAMLDQTARVGLTGPAGPGLGLICRDFDGDRRPDIYAAYDQSPNPLWLQQEGGQFVDDGVARGVATSGLGQPQASMGVAWGDFNGDGWTDLFITNIRGEINTLYHGSETGSFRDATAQSGMTTDSLTRTGFGVSAFDFELDGDLDLAVVNGRVKRDVPLPFTDTPNFWSDYAEPNQLFLNDGRGKFMVRPQAGLYAMRAEVTRALAVADVDNDGDLDLLTTGCGGPVRLWRNDAPREGTWLRVRLIDARGPRDGVGAKITVRTGDRVQVREVNPSASYLSSHDPRAHFGLGSVTTYDQLTVEWADGTLWQDAGGQVDREVVVHR